MACQTKSWEHTPRFQGAHTEFQWSSSCDTMKFELRIHGAQWALSFGKITNLLYNKRYKD